MWAKYSQLLAKPANQAKAAAYATSTAEAIKAPCCLPTETCPYIKASLGGEGSAFVDICDIVADGYKTTFSCSDNKKTSNDEVPMVYIVLLVVIAVFLLISASAVVFMYKREKSGEWKIGYGSSAK